MKHVLSALAAAAALASPGLAAFRPGSAVKVNPPSSIGYIIELEPNSSIGGRTFDGAHGDAHSAFHRRAQDVLEYSARHEFKDPEYFYGLSINAKNDTDVDALLTLPQVKKVWPNRYYDRPVPVVPGRPPKAANPSNPIGIRAPAKRDAAKVVTINGTSDVLSSLKMTGADQVHAQGFTGKGIKIGFLDTGVDYRHPALGGGYGEGFKVAGGYDLVGDAFEGWNDPVPDDDPLTTCLDGGHGTHVAGILAARDPEDVGFGVVGVAPDASLYAYRVLGCVGGVTDDILLQGFVKAASDGVDLISMSIGETAVWEEGSPYTPVLAKIQSQGIGIVIAAGNEGDSGLYVASAPALDASAISVGSVSDLIFATIYNAAGSDGSTIEYARVVPLEETTSFNVFVADDEKGDCSNQAWDDAVANFPDKDNVIALVTATSNCYYEAIDTRSNSSGFKNVWSWIPDDSDFNIDSPGAYGNIDTVQVKKSNADKILAGLAEQGTNFTLSFQDQTVHQAEQPTGGTTSYFSTFGPTLEMSLKPQVSAPGGTILSTWVTSNGWGYAIISGTSMATPHIAGCYALLKQKFPGLTPQQITRRLQSSAIPLKQFGGNGILTTTAQQGSGLVNILRAINTETVFSATEFNLQDTSSTITRNFTIENHSLDSKTYMFGHKGAAEVDGLPKARSNDVDEMFYWSPNFRAAYAQVSFHSESITIPAGSQATVEFTVTPPVVDPALLPTYSGFITVTEVDDEFAIPYLGIPYSRGDLTNLYTGDVGNLGIEPKPPAGVPALPAISSSDSSVRNNDKVVYTFPAKRGSVNETQLPDNDPIITVFIDQPSTYVRLDVVPFDLASNPTHNFTPSSFGYIPGASPNIPGASPNTTIVSNTTFTRPKLELDLLDDFAGVKSYGLIGSLYGGDRPHGATSINFRGYSLYSTEWTWGVVELANGTIYQLPNADYRVLVRALKWGRDLNDPSAYDSWLSPVIGIDITDPGVPNPWLSS
ncbi:Minor extracellular protease vpr 6 [Colletotrichum chlorophyti]|uniref:Minor extracellular protease vpr 6 n=1 Tax=Colletotrichum chlorophyti TaxID=708187 RepID=A0A1Q8RT35_9PEZI|nr:Minor extracellular protease vpr 6 [Colletotrichum chlorophyti]